MAGTPTEAASTGLFYKHRKPKKKKKGGETHGVSRSPSPYERFKKRRQNYLKSKLNQLAFAQQAILKPSDLEQTFVISCISVGWEGSAGHSGGAGWFHLTSITSLVVGWVLARAMGMIWPRATTQAGQCFSHSGSVSMSKDGERASPQGQVLLQPLSYGLNAYPLKDTCSCPNPSEPVNLDRGF